ncbi:MAG: hypothetical protein AAB555_02720 [Patescibacteria group bacterium]
MLPPGIVTGGGVDEQELSHWMVPLDCVCPQALADEVQEFPYPDGAGGGVDEQEPSHWMVPFDCVCPQTFAAEVQAEP